MKKCTRDKRHIAEESLLDARCDYLGYICVVWLYPALRYVIMQLMMRNWFHLGLRGLFYKTFAYSITL